MSRKMSILSLGAYRTLKPKLTNREEWVLEAIEELQPCTAAQVAEHYKVGEHVISGRFTGLKAKHRIEHVYNGRNKFGSKVGYYSVVREEVDERGDEY